MVKRTVRNYGKGHDLTDVDDIARMLNSPDNKPADDAWACERHAIVLPPIEHGYQNVSSIPGIKKFSCFTTVAHNRTMMKPLPCGRSCCMSFQMHRMVLCPNRHMTGWNDKTGAGQAVVHYRMPEPKSKRSIVLSPRSRPIKRKPADFKTAEISAQTRKGRVAHPDDKPRYGDFTNNFECTEDFTRSLGSFLVAPASPLHPSASASTPVTPANPVAAPSTEPSALRRTTWTRGGGRKKKRKNRKGGGRPKDPRTKLRKRRQGGK